MLFYRHLENKGKPSLILLHGFLGGMEDFSSLVKELKTHFSLYLLSLPGHGKSKEVPITLESIKETIETLPLSSYHLLGYSLGGRLARKLEEDPRCKSLILLSTHPGLVSQEEKNERRLLDEKWIVQLENTPFSLFLQAWYNQELFSTLRRKKRLFEALIKRREKEDPQKLACVLKTFGLAQEDYKSDFKKPTLALHGEYDKKFTLLYTKLNEPVTVVTIENASHTVHLENPKQCGNNITTFIRSLKE